MARQFFSGNSLDQAVMAAARTFSIDPTEVQYTIREKKHGFVNARRRFVIEVDPESPKKEVVEADVASPEVASESLSLLAGVKPPAAAKKEDKPRAGRKRPASRHEPAPEDDDESDEVVEAVSEDVDDDTPDSEDDPAEEAESYDDDEVDDDEDDDEDDDDGEEDGEEDLDDDEEIDGDEDPEVAAFLRAGNKLIDILDVELDVKVERRDDEFFVDFTGEEADLLTEDDGKILQAIEQLLPRMVRGLVGHGLPCSIDCEGFKEDKVNELKELADSAAADAKDSGDEILLKPMSPADRRVVHMALADDPDVETESSGDGFMKRVRIVPL